MSCRKGLGLNKGMGYKNLIPSYDSHRHALNAKGYKMPQRIPLYMDFSNRKSIKKAEIIKGALERKGYVPQKTIQLGVDKWKTEYIKGGKSILNKGDSVKAKYFAAKGTILSKDPFAVKYNYQGRTYVRLSNPKYWQKGGKAGFVLVAMTKGKETVYLTLPKQDISKVAKELGYNAKVVKGGKLPESVSKFFESAGQKIKQGATWVGEKAKQAYEWEKEHLPEQKKAIQEFGTKIKEGIKEAQKAYKKGKEEQEIKERQKEKEVAPIYHKMVKQQGRVEQIKEDIAHNEEKGLDNSKLHEELESEQEQLRDIQEKITEHPLEDLSDSQLRHLSIVTEDTSLFGSGNRYETELLRRIQRTKEVDKKIKEERRKPVDEGFW
jgi:hypothetical protein